jgi:hypothetical protein
MAHDASNVTLGKVVMPVRDSNMLNQLTVLNNETFENHTAVCDFRLQLRYEFCILVGCYAVQTGNSVPTFRENLSGLTLKGRDSYVLLTVHLSIIFVNNQLDTQFFFIYV